MVGRRRSRNTAAHFPKGGKNNKWQGSGVARWLDYVGVISKASTSIWRMKGHMPMEEGASENGSMPCRYDETFADQLMQALCQCSKLLEGRALNKKHNTQGLLRVVPFFARCSADSDDPWLVARASSPPRS